jgi:DNA-binding NarL/FixJ family response regulator
VSIPVGIVEDDDPFRMELVERINGSTRFHCINACGSAEEALDRFAQTQPAIALVDLELPRMGGLELIPRLRQLLPELEIMVLTQHDDDACLFGALEAGAYGYLTKPASRDELLAAMDLLSAGGTPMTPGIARRVLQAFQSRGDTRRELARLTEMDRRILELVARGLSRKEVADEVQLSPSAVYYHLRKTCKALQVNCAAKAVAKFRSAHPVAPNPGQH